MPATFTMPAPLRAAIDAELASMRTPRTEASARRLSDRYLADRPATAPILVTDDDAAAYLTTRMPATFAAIGLALEQLRDVVPSFSPATLLDLGSGTGAATWAAWEVFETLTQARLEDYSAPALAAAQRMLDTTDLSVTTRLADATTANQPAAQEPVDLALSCYALSALTQTQTPAAVNRAPEAATRWWSSPELRPAINAFSRSATSSSPPGGRSLRPARIRACARSAPDPATGATLPFGWIALAPTGRPKAVNAATKTRSLPTLRPCAASRSKDRRLACCATRSRGQVTSLSICAVAMAAQH